MEPPPADYREKKKRGLQRRQDKGRENLASLFYRADGNVAQTNHDPEMITQPEKKKRGLWRRPERERKTDFYLGDGNDAQTNYDPEMITHQLLQMLFLGKIFSSRH